MGAGKLRHLVQIRKYEAVKNDYGEESKTWVLFSNAWAEVKPLKAEEYFSAFGTEHTATHRIIIRYIAGLTSDMDIFFEGRQFEIVGVRDYFERHKYIEIIAKENNARN